MTSLKHHRPPFVKDLVTGLLWLMVVAGLSCGPGTSEPRESRSAVPDVRISPEADLQAEVDQAADSGATTVILKAGIYRPRRSGQALLVLTRRHDGLRIVAEEPGQVVLTAENELLADADQPGYPAIVNHIVLTGDGVSPRTVLQGLTMTGANGYVTESLETLRRDYPEFPGGLSPGMFFFLDGGAVKVFGDSAPQFLDCCFSENRTRLCGGAVSIEQGFQSQEPVRFRNCVFRDNRCPATGAAVDVLSGGLADFENCLFTGNIANTGMDEIARTTGLAYNQKHGCGALTVFPRSRVHVRSCTFTANWNGVDDHGSGSVYENSIFWKNDVWDGTRSGEPYELDVQGSATVSGCLISGRIPDLRGSVSRRYNVFDAPDPQFDDCFRPRNAACQTAGFRPVDGICCPPGPADGVTESGR